MQICPQEISFKDKTMTFYLQENIWLYNSIFVFSKIKSHLKMSVWMSLVLLKFLYDPQTGVDRKQMDKVELLFFVIIVHF